MALTIRRAVDGDAPAVVEIFNEAIATRIAVAYFRAVTVAERQAWFDEHRVVRHPLYVACDGGEIVGWFSVGIFENRPAYNATAEVSLYVARAWHGGGVGHHLMAHALDEARALGIETFVARIWHTNARSIAFFEREGFEFRGCLPAVARIDGETRDLLYYMRRTSR